MSKKILFAFVLFTSFLGMAQSSLNDYNMAIIPARFDFQEDNNQYRINSTIKTFLQQKGFEVYLSTDDMPEGFVDYNCNKVFINLIEQSNMFSTKLQVEFKDCKNKVLYVTDLGESRDKNVAKSYNEALLFTLKTFNKANYKYSGKTYYNEEADEKIKSRDVENVSKEVTKVIKSEKEEIRVFSSVTEPENNVNFIIATEIATQKELKLYKTSNTKVFLTDFKGRSGVVFFKEQGVFFEYLENGEVTSKKLNIKL